MARRSTIDELDPRIKKSIDACLREGVTIDELVKKILQLGASVSRSAVGRYSKNFNDTMEKVNQARFMANALVDDIGDQSEQKIARANIELLHSALMNLLVEAEGNVPAKMILPLARAAKELAAATKLDQEAIIEASKIMQKKAAQAVDGAAVSMGMTAETREKFNKIIFGIEA